MGAFDARTSQPINQFITRLFGLYLLYKQSTFGPAALGHCVYKSDTNLIGMLYILLTAKLLILPYTCLQL